MKMMLDTNICIFIIRKKPPTVLKHLGGYSAGDVGISSITLAELRFGVMKSSQPHSNRQALYEFMLPLEIADFDERAAREYGEIRAYLEKSGRIIGALDTLIGAHALSINATLVTNNVNEFKRIKNLKVSDWT